MRLIDTPEALLEALDGGSLVDATVRGVTLQGRAFAVVNLAVVTFEGCTFSELAWVRCAWTVVAFLGCTLDGVLLAETSASDVAFLPDDAGAPCSLSRLVLGAAVCKRSVLEGCVLSQTAFGASQLGAWSVDDCTFSDAVWRDSVLSDAHNTRCALPAARWLDQADARLDQADARHGVFSGSLMHRTSTLETRWFDASLAAVTGTDPKLALGEDLVPGRGSAA